MTISSALNAGVAGLSANATRLATIADNIANSGTYGYKRAYAEFSNLVITQSRGSGVYSAGGVRASTMRLIEERGGLVGTSHPLDLAVSGRGMLPVMPEVALGSGAGDRALLMTTTGSFRTDQNGVLKTEFGQVLMAWPANSDGTVPIFPRDTIAGLVPVVINANQTAGDPTTKMTVGVNLPATGTEFEASGAALPFAIEYFGNLGTSEALHFAFQPVLPNAAGDPNTNTWIMEIRDSADNNAVIGVYRLEFDDSRAAGGTLLDVNVEPATATWPAYDASTGTLPLQVAGGPMTVTIGRIGDPNGLTQLSDDFAPVQITKDGSPVGNLTTVEVDANGYLIATYDTGFNRVLYQIPLVDVPNPKGLLSLHNQTYQVSPQSGSFFLWDAGDGPTGSVEGFAREESTTDVAAELTSLIQTQRAYASNAKVITTVDEMLQETTNIKR